MSMCGIVGYTGPRRAVDIVVEGLRRLEYRGYDSAGVAVVENGRIGLEKKAGKLANLTAALAAPESPVGETALELVPAPDEAERALESWAVSDALSSLRPEHKRVLLETYYRGKSVNEAAATLGVPAGTVKSRTFYALRALRLALEERGLAP